MTKKEKTSVEYPLGTICENCGHIYGLHQASDDWCPDKMKTKSTVGIYGNTKFKPVKK